MTLLSVIQAETVFLPCPFPESSEPLWRATQARSKKKYKTIPYVSNSLKVLVHISFKLCSCSKTCKRCFYCLAIGNLSGGLWHSSQCIRHFPLKTHHKEKSSRTPSCLVGPWDILSQEFCITEVADLFWRKQVLWEQSTWPGVWVHLGANRKSHIFKYLLSNNCSFDTSPCFKHLILHLSKPCLDS